MAWGMRKDDQQNPEPPGTTRIRTHFWDPASIAGCEIGRTKIPYLSSYDKSPITKAFHAHLLQIHNLAYPNHTKKLNMNQPDLDKWCRKGVVLPKVELNNQTLKSALFYMIANCDFLFAIAAIATHTICMYHLSEETIKESYLAKHILISFTQDAWTSPNVTDCLYGSHSPLCQFSSLCRKRFADLFYETLSKYQIFDQLHTLTANNVLVNMNPMDISLLVSPPDGADINSKTIIKRVHSLCTWVRFLPQQQDRFEITFPSCQLELHKSKIKVPNPLELQFLHFSMGSLALKIMQPFLQT
ncbi:uncharacterized protein VP01_921g5 [Puccinia sorghi]|uniref:Uncharacterized protein n=1 Tax=Puccinia sorghi TaxID=27349 RepID=A0A0L6U7A6_9BASI|nr:uncharacterized protein VP01_921g5 [Puccinia sorghi]